MTRTRQLLGGLGFGYTHAVVATVAGLWLTPFLLRSLGQEDYGLWLLGTQVLVYLALLDLGVVALVPRDVAYRTGRVSLASETDGDVVDVVAEAVRLVGWQMPAVALAGLAVWLWLPEDWAALHGPLAIVLATFVLSFPLRLLPAVLQGLQDLVFVGRLQLWAWGLGLVATVGLVWAGAGMYALAASYAATQVVQGAGAVYRLRRRFPEVWPSSFRLASASRLGAPASASRLRARLGRSAWVSVTQLAHVLLNGTELIVIGRLLGPEAVVPYACTAKLVTLAANQPQLVMQLAVPALSELRAGVSRAELFRVTHGMSHAMLVASGAVVAVTLAVNGPFIEWWVGAERFGGLGLTVGLVVVMLLRHWNLAAGYTLFCFGHERRLALTGVADGLVTVVGMLVLVPVFGLAGAPLGSLAGVCAVSLPNNLRALAAEQGASVGHVLRPLLPWAIRFVPFVLLLGTLAARVQVAGIAAIVAVATAVFAAYVVVMLPIVTTPPLGSVVVPRLTALVSSVPVLQPSVAWIMRRFEPHAS